MLPGLWIGPIAEVPGRKITEDGFTANWNVFYFGRNFPQAFREIDRPNAQAELGRSAFGVALFQPVDHYQKSNRAIKYAVLFIALTFLAFFLFEVIYKLKIHPLQYLLVGVAMSLFYLLFLSLSEHTEFLLSYIVAATATVGLITGYCSKVLGQRKRALVLGGFLTTLYAYLFVLLQNEDYSLLLGAIALFLVLSAVMYLTRNIDWYDLRLPTPAQEAG